MVFNLYLKNIWISFKTQIRKGKIRKSLYTGLTDDSIFYTSVKCSYQSLDKYIHQLNRRYLKLMSVQLSRTLVFQGVSRLYSPVKPTIFEINVGAVVQNVGFSRDF